VVQLGKLRYAAVATRAFHAAHFAAGVGSATLAEAPLVAFHRSDSLQHDFVRRVTRRRLAPPVTYLPSVREFDRAIRVGMGWGLLPEYEVTAELARGDLIELVPGKRTDVQLFWQHWTLGSAIVADLTTAVVAAARGWLNAEASR
jgi:LysR family transcriptional regulator (chromosome initiation inhibitor)